MLFKFVFSNRSHLFTESYMGAHVDNILALLRESEWLGLHFTSMGTHKARLCPPHLPPTQPRPPENSLETAALIPITPPERNWATERGAICLGSHNLKSQASLHPHGSLRGGNGHQVTLMWHLVLRTLGHLIVSCGRWRPIVLL